MENELIKKQFEKIEKVISNSKEKIKNEGSDFNILAQPLIN